MSTRVRFFDRIRDMFDIVREWWVVRNLRKFYIEDSKGQTTEQALRGNVISTQSRFVEWLAMKSCRRWQWIFPWSWWVSTKRLNGKIVFYNLIIDNCIRGEGENRYIAIVREAGNERFICPTNPVGWNYYGYFSLWEKLQNKHPITWSGIWKLSAFITTTIAGTGVLGYFLTNIVRIYLLKLPPF